jgi:hypothetical protein
MISCATEVDPDSSEGLFDTEAVEFNSELSDNDLSTDYYEVSEKFFGEEESEILENDVLTFVNSYRPYRIGFNAFQMDSSIYKALKVSSKEKFKKEEYIVNTLLLKQTLFNIQEQCFGGHNMLECARKDKVLEWVLDSVLEELQMEFKKSKELFCMDELYYYIKDKPENDLQYDSSHIGRIGTALDSCD